MMGVFEWLSTPGGLEFTHAVSLFVIAAAGYFTWRTHKRVQNIDARVNGKGKHDGSSTS